MRRGTVIALMGSSEDSLGKKFTRSGGTALRSDGRFFWRLDAADCVEHYGVALPEEFLAHGAARRWTTRSLTRDEVIEVDSRLGELRRAGAL